MFRDLTNISDEQNLSFQFYTKLYCEKILCGKYKNRESVREREGKEIEEVRNYYMVKNAQYNRCCISLYFWLCSHESFPT